MAESSLALPIHPAEVQRDPLDGLHRITGAANSARSLADALQTVAETVVDVMGIDVCSVFLFDPDDQRLYLHATQGLNRRAIGQVGLVLGEGVTGRAAQEGKLILVADVQQEPRFHTIPILNEQRVGSMVAVPIILFARQAGDAGDNELLGVITVQAHAHRAFGEDEVHFLEVVAGELAFFIANTRRYEQTDEQLRQKVRELTAVQKKLETSLRLKGALLEELDHRVGNTLMMVKSLLDMQRRRLDPAAEAAQVLSQSIEHILAIADVQRLLRNEDDVITTVEEIARQVIQRKQSLTANTPVRFGLHVSPISISSHDANLLALVLNELIDNALRHGLAAEGGMVQVEASRDVDQLVVEVRDDGPLHPAGTPPPSSGRGHSIIQTLVENQGGSFDFHRDREWARARVCFPYKPPAP